MNQEKLEKINNAVSEGNEDALNQISYENKDIWATDFEEVKKAVEEGLKEIKFKAEQSKISENEKKQIENLGGTAEKINNEIFYSDKILNIEKNADTALNSISQENKEEKVRQQYNKINELSKDGKVDELRIMRSKLDLIADQGLFQSIDQRLKEIENLKNDTVVKAGKGSPLDW